MAEATLPNWRPLRLTSRLKKSNDFVKRPPISGNRRKKSRKRNINIIKSDNE